MEHFKKIAFGTFLALGSCALHSAMSPGISGDYNSLPPEKPLRQGFNTPLNSGVYKVGSCTIVITENEPYKPLTSREEIQRRHLLKRALPLVTQVKPRKRKKADLKIPEIKKQKNKLLPSPTPDENSKRKSAFYSPLVSSEPIDLSIYADDGSEDNLFALAQDGPSSAGP
jgi:hypothetical protein